MHTRKKLLSDCMTPIITRGCRNILPSESVALFFRKGRSTHQKVSLDVRQKALSYGSVALFIRKGALHTRKKLLIESVAVYQKSSRLYITCRWMDS